MLIVADENIPYIRPVFAGCGEVRLLPGRSLSAEAVKEADFLLVRSVTRVDRGLLEGSRVRFVATATTGTDHVDRDWLARNGIGFADAAGSNARSVVDYFFAVLFRWLVRTRRTLEGLSVGVVGCGRIGSVIADLLERLGVRVLRNDPPLEASGMMPPGGWSLLSGILSCDVVTIHTPLTRERDHPTWHLCGKDFFSSFRGGLFINAARGAVCDNAALRNALARRRFDTVLDVWEGEPCPDGALMEAVHIGTPHIAGYSLNGKFNGTLMVRDAVLSHIGRNDFAPEPVSLPPPGKSSLSESGEAGTLEERVSSVLSQVYDPGRDDQAFRPLAGLIPSERSLRFDALRREYPVRREFPDYALSGISTDAVRILRVLGFRGE